jgi:type II secretory pathway pseudopilin PulG
MTIRKTRRHWQTAFTLIELIVVVIIIVLIMSLLLVGVFKALDKGNEAKARSEVSQLSQAIQAFLTRYNVPYIPSRIRLYNSLSFTTSFPPPATQTSYDLSLIPSGMPGAGTPNNPLEYDSFQYLNRVWPRLGSTTSTVSWSFTPTPAMSPFSWDLEGEECLVFFLGGIPGSGAAGFVCQGFSSTPSDPTAISAGAIVSPVPPSFNFPSNRLIIRSGQTGGFFSFADPYGWGTPYAYFSSYKTANGYNRYFGTTLVAGLSDCASIQPTQNPHGVWPYAEAQGTASQFLNPTSFQIICAGKDGVFGMGTPPIAFTNVAGPPPSATPWSPPGYYLPLPASPFIFIWSPKNAGDPYSNPKGLPGFDDISNFYDQLLGVPST